MSATATGTGQNQSCPNSTQAQPLPPCPATTSASICGFGGTTTRPYQNGSRKRQEWPARARGDDLTWLLTTFLAEDARRRGRWSRALADLAVAQRPENRGVLAKWVTRWAARADDAALGLGTILEAEAGVPADGVAARAERDGTKRGPSCVSPSGGRCGPRKATKNMLPLMRRLFPAALLLTASGALADSPLPRADVPAREIVTRTPTQGPTEEQLQALTRAIESLEAEVQGLRTDEAERARQRREREENSLKLWP